MSLYILHGGSFDLVPWDLRSAFRFRVMPEGRNVVIGFRLIQEKTENSHQIFCGGGSWYDKPVYLCSAYRDWNYIDVRYNYLGFRLIQENLPKDNPWGGVEVDA